LESLARAVVVLDGHPAPRSQVWLRTARGDVRVDLLDPGGRVIIEADGRVKYTTPETLWQEKLREDALRATGREMVRFTYRDYLDPGPWLTHYRAALQRTYGVT
jgi:very-short-patch-repair endonuclease